MRGPSCGRPWIFANTKTASLIFIYLYWTDLLVNLHCYLIVAVVLRTTNNCCLWIRIIPLYPAEGLKFSSYVKLRSSVILLLGTRDLPQFYYARVQKLNLIWGTLDWSTALGEARKNLNCIFTPNSIRNPYRIIIFYKILIFELHIWPEVSFESQHVVSSCEKRTICRTVQRFKFDLWCWPGVNRETSQNWHSGVELHGESSGANSFGV